MYQTTFSEVIDILLYVLTGLLIPFVGTLIGSSFVFFMKKTPDVRLMTFFDSIAAGVMCAASFFSLIRPACERAEESGGVQLLLCSVGFFSGIITFVIISGLLCLWLSEKGEHPGKLLLLAVSVHNVPEGMAVGVVYAGLLASSVTAEMSAALSLSLGIALQNIPEGAIISIPLKSKGENRARAFVSGMLSGVAELIPAVLTLFLFSVAQAVLPFLLCFAAGAMIYVVLKELSAGFQSERNGAGALTFFALGFTLMMLLDTLFG